MTKSNSEIKNQLKEVLQHIQNKNYLEAKRLLQECNGHPLADKLAMHFDNVAAYSARISSSLHASQQIQ